MSQLPNAGFQPLFWPEGERPRERNAPGCVLALVMIGGVIAGFAHSLLWLLLTVAAWIAAVLLHGRAGRPSRKGVAAQLRARRVFPADAWGSSARASTAQLAGRVIADEIGWPNSYFLPGDSLEILMFCPSGDGIEGMAILIALEKETGRRWHLLKGATFGEFIDSNG